MTKPTIRDELPGDAAAISALIEATFAVAQHADGTEAQIVERLRILGDLTLSLGALDGDEIIGHAAFSPVTIAGEDLGWFGLGPVAVAPHRQRGGVGVMLIETGLARLRAHGAAGCVVLGNPAYYGRFGFRHHPALIYPGPPPPAFQALAFGGAVPAGEVRYSAAFG